MIERFLEDILFRSRWLLTPLYLGLVVALAVLAIKFIQELLHIVPHALDAEGTELIVDVLGLVDLVLVSNLLLMIIFNGFESFVSKIDAVQDHEDRPDWMGKIDYSALKLKVIGSVAAISTIELLRNFMHLHKIEHKEDLYWLITLHATFVLSGLFFALMEWLTHSSAHKSEHEH